MEFKIATASDTEAVKDLWAYCFEPADNPFFQYYFTKAYEPENTVVGYEQGELVSMVHLRQYKLNVRGAAVPVSYMVGVATAPTARRGGVGAKLLVSSLEELRRRGQGLTILMPSKAAFYQQYGWDLYAHQWTRTMALDELRPLTERTLHFGRLRSADEWMKLAPVYEAYTKGLCGYAIRGEKEWRRLIESWLAENVQIAYVQDEVGRIEGYGAFKLGEPTIPMSELVYGTRRGQRAVLNYVYNHRSQGSSIWWNEGIHDEGYLFHPNAKEGYGTMPFMMSRIVDVPLAFAQVPAARAALAQAAAATTVNDERTITFTLAVTDSLADWNQGTYQVTVDGTGKATATKTSEDVVADAEATITIGGLSLLLMGRLSASELVFEGKLQATDDVSKTLDTLYPKQKMYINEWW